MLTKTGTLVDRNPFRFSTKYWDNETGWGYWDERFYDPLRGRWFNRDLIGERGGWNLYEYARNRPTTGIDPYGLLLEEFFNWCYNDKWASGEELADPLRNNGKGPSFFRNVRGREAVMFRDAGEAAVGLTNVGLICQNWVNPIDVARETGRECLDRADRAEAATSARLGSVAVAQMEAGATLDEATSPCTLTGVFVGDLVGVTPALEVCGDIDLESNAPLSEQPVECFGNERNRRGVQACAQLILVFAPTGARASAGTCESSGCAARNLFGSEWYHSFCTRFGAENVEWQAVPRYAGGRTQGVLVTCQGEYGLTSGMQGGPSGCFPAGTIPGRNGTIKYHVEAHCAAVLRQQNLKCGTLIINQKPCVIPEAFWLGCDRNLPAMLPKGCKLRVVAPGCFERTYIGAPE